VSSHYNLPHAAKEEDGFQIWRIAANTMNKQLLIEKRDGPSAWGAGLGRRLTHSHHRNIIMTHY
jgi:hypothetical protein